MRYFRLYMYIKQRTKHGRYKGLGRVRSRMRRYRNIPVHIAEIESLWIVLSLFVSLYCSISFYPANNNSIENGLAVVAAVAVKLLCVMGSHIKGSPRAAILCLSLSFSCSPDRIPPPRWLKRPFSVV